MTAFARVGFRLTHLVECGDSSDDTGLPSGFPGAFVLSAVEE